MEELKIIDKFKDFFKEDEIDQEDIEILLQMIYKRNIKTEKELRPAMLVIFFWNNVFWCI
jgi:hypothetical protein